MSNPVTFQLARHGHFSLVYSVATLDKCRDIIKSHQTKAHTLVWDVNPDGGLICTATDEWEMPEHWTISTVY